MIRRNNAASISRYSARVLGAAIVASMSMVIFSCTQELHYRASGTVWDAASGKKLPGADVALCYTQWKTELSLSGSYRRSELVPFAWSKTDGNGGFEISVSTEEDYGAPFYVIASRDGCGEGRAEVGYERMSENPAAVTLSCQ